MALLSLHDPSYKTTSGSSLHNPYRFTKTKAILLVVLGLAFLCFVGLTGCSNASSSTESSSTDNNTQPSEPHLQLTPILKTQHLLPIFLRQVIPKKLLKI